MLVLHVRPLVLYQVRHVWLHFVSQTQLEYPSLANKTGRLSLALACQTQRVRPLIFNSER